MPHRRSNPPRPRATPDTTRDTGHAKPLPSRIESLTGLRGMAALGVLAYHAWLLAHMPDPAPGVPVLSPGLDWLLRIGWSGVDVFFTLSAFLLTLPFARAAKAGAPPPDWRAYLRRRGARILPAYWLQLGLVFAAALAGLAWGRATPPWPGWHSAVAHLVLWLNAGPRIEPLFAHWWTLPVEFGFYLLLPLLAWALTPRRWPWLLGLVVVAWAWRAYWLLHPRTDYAHLAWVDQLPGRIDQFAIGMLAAWAWVCHEARGRQVAPRSANALLLASGLAFLALPGMLLLDGRPNVNPSVSLHPVVLAWHGLASVPVAGLLIACVAGAPWAARGLASRPMLWLGDISYSVYLWHLPVIAWVVWQSGELATGDFWPYFAACLLLTLGLASASWWCVERPAQAWAARRR